MRPWMSLLPLLLVSTMQPSCGSFDPIMTTTGESMTVELLGGRKDVVELLAVEDSAVLCLARDESPRSAAGGPSGVVRRFPADSISRIGVSGFRNNYWWLGVLAFQVLPAVGLGAAAASVDDAKPDAVIGISLIPAALSAIFFASSGLPTPVFPGPLTEENLAELRKYARFGGTLSKQQKADLLRAYGQGPGQ